VLLQHDPSIIRRRTCHRREVPRARLTSVASWNPGGSDRYANMATARWGDVEVPGRGSRSHHDARRHRLRRPVGGAAVADPDDDDAGRDGTMVQARLDGRARYGNRAPAERPRG